jgi:hypothetical protein
MTDARYRARSDHAAVAADDAKARRIAPGHRPEQPLALGRPDPDDDHRADPHAPARPRDARPRRGRPRAVVDRQPPRPPVLPRRPSDPAAATTAPRSASSWSTRNATRRLAAGQGVAGLRRSVRGPTFDDTPRPRVPTRLEAERRRPGDLDLRRWIWRTADGRGTIMFRGSLAIRTAGATRRISREARVRFDRAKPPFTRARPCSASFASRVRSVHRHRTREPSVARRPGASRWGDKLRDYSHDCGALPRPGRPYRPCGRGFAPLLWDGSGCRRLHAAGAGSDPGDRMKATG